MATIVIKDLQESIDLDHEAMLAVTGGARSGARPLSVVQPAAQSNRIVDYPTGVKRSGIIGSGITGRKPEQK